VNTLNRRVVIVSGSPGAGKTSVAEPLAEELGFALISKDFIKEKLHDLLGAPPTGAVLGAPPTGEVWSRKLGQVAMELMWDLAWKSPSAVLDANFRPDEIRHKNNIEAYGNSLVEVHCSCPPDIALRRYNERASIRHAVHFPRVLSLDYFAEYDRPVGSDQLITVDTTARVDIAALAEEVRRIVTSHAANS
jgi:predicted kinase